jgi:hypothetical protein
LYCCSFKGQSFNVQFRRQPGMALGGFGSLLARRGSEAPEGFRLAPKLLLFAHPPSANSQGLSPLGAIKASRVGRQACGLAEWE